MAFWGGFPIIIVSMSLHGVFHPSFHPYIQIQLPLQPDSRKTVENQKTGENPEKSPPFDPVPIPPSFSEFPSGIVIGAIEIRRYQEIRMTIKSYKIHITYC